MCFCSYKSAILDTKNYLAFSPIQSQKTLTLNNTIIEMKPKTLRFRVSNSEYYIIKNKAKQAGVTISEFVRSRSLDYDLTYKLTEEEIRIYKQLNSFSDNFRRISNLFKLGDITQVKEVSVETAELIRKHLEKLKK